MTATVQKHDDGEDPSGQQGTSGTAPNGRTQNGQDDNQEHQSK